MFVGTAAIAASPSAAMEFQQDDSVLPAFEEQIFQAYERATAYDDEILRVFDAWSGKHRRLYDEVSGLMFSK
jgi:hypothetical protein